MKMLRHPAFVVGLFGVVLALPSFAASRGVPLL
jgi:hypothetical protein